MSSDVMGGEAAITWMDAATALSGSAPKMASKSVRNAEITGAGMLRVGEKTIPTLRTLILLTIELFTMLIKNADNARTKLQFANGNLWTSTLYALIFAGLSSSSAQELVSQDVDVLHSKMSLT